MEDTGTNVDKGLVGLYYLHDALDCNDETKGFRLPSGEYDIPIVLYDLRLDDGIAPHDGVNGANAIPYGVIQDNQPHPENWGQLFFGHWPHKGFVGRHLHGQRQGDALHAGQAAEVPPAVPRRLDRPLVRTEADGRHAAAWRRGCKGNGS